MSKDTPTSNSEGAARSHKRGKLTAQFGELVISSDFDSGNLDRVEECKSNDADTKEFNLWTAPDCAGTEFENCNRTWFYFTVSTPANYGHRNIRFNVQNLNKQSRLYQQGLTPMIKIFPGRGVWERLRDRPEHEPAEGGGLRLSFQLTVAESRRQTIHVAFCFPFSYTESQKMLTKLESKYSSEVGSQQSSEVVETSSVDHSPQSCDAMGNKIYFHRELLCYTLENRRVDLVTVSSCEGISEERESRLPALFPDQNCVRARAFRGKKGPFLKIVQVTPTLREKIQLESIVMHGDKKTSVYFLTSRVHPGESPSSHVFNGFLQFLLRPDDPRAQVLRRHFVFKLVPMLNPDGVFNGHYRTDTRGMNLNRVYLDPTPDLHPSIFAARSLLLYHHKKGQLNNITEPKPQFNVRRLTSCNCIASRHTSGNSNGGVCGGGVVGSEFKLLSVSEKGCSCVCSFSYGLSGWCGHEVVSQTSDMCSTVSHSMSHVKQSVAGGGSSQLRASSMNALSNVPGSHTHIPLSLGCSPGNTMTSSSPSILTTQHKDRSVSVLRRPTPTTNTTHSDKMRDDKETTTNNSVLPPESMIATKQSGVAFYVDLHAHATKRGVFMYGNYFNNAVEQAENMLFPKLISLNSPHLDFEHCVFSEKNMYTADKRDGLSKEGSGRVAMHKATGLIHCYTLECNYNSGRQGNALTAATMDNGRASPPVPPSPMGHRFSIQDFEQVGRALAVSALDMYQLNPWSRLPTTDYGSVAGVRQSLLQRISTLRTKRNTTSKKQGPALNLNEPQQVSFYNPATPSSRHSTVGHLPPECLATSNHGDSPSQSMTSSPSSAASVQACKVLLLQRQKALAAVKGSGQIAAEVARVSEARRKPRSKQVELKVSLSPCLPLKRATLRTTRSTTLQRQYLEKQGQLNIMKPSLHRVVFPLCKTLRIQTDGKESAKEQPPALGSKVTDEHATAPLTSSGTATQTQPDTSPKLPLKRKKLLKHRSRNIILKQSSCRRLAIAQKDSYPTKVPHSLAVSDSEIICKLSRPARFKLRHRAFTSTQVRY